MQRILFTWLLGSALLVRTVAQDAEIFDSFIQKALAVTPMVPGIGVAVVKDGQPVFVRAYGMADVEANLPATTETAYYIASVTKSFTGLLALQLADDGTIDLDAPLTRYRPFSTLKNKAMFEDVTIRHLLNHTSGLENGYIVFREAYTGDKSLKTLTMLLEEKTEKSAPGKYQYSNLGYNLFTLLLEAEFGWKWQDLLQERIFEPLKMTHTTAYISKAEKEKWTLAAPYLGYVSDKPERAYLMKNDAMMQSAGGMVCSVEDAANWMIAYLNQGQLNGKKVLKPAWVEAGLKPTATYSREGDIFTDEGYGMGWITAKFRDQTVNYHFGGYQGFFSHISIMPEQNVGIAVFANEVAFGDNVSNLIASFIYDYYLGEVAHPEDYADKLVALKDRIADVQKNIAKHYEQLNQREWQLELPKSAYEGTFYSKYIGTVEVAERQGNLHVTLGPLRAVATPYTAKNSLRVEFAGSGEVLIFDVQDGQVKHMVYDGDVLERVK